MTEEEEISTEISSQTLEQQEKIKNIRQPQDMTPEENVIGASSLTKFRKLRLKDLNRLDLLINRMVSIALEKRIIKSKSIIVDATHTQARYNQKKPCEILRDKSKLFRKSVYQIDETVKGIFPKIKQLVFSLATRRISL